MAGNPSKLAPFWRYYGGKNRAACHYPAPEHDTIVEPFAGAAGYACRYYDRRVILVDSSPVIAGVWRYLIATPAAEILRLPDIPAGGTTNDLPVCQEARWLAGFWCNTGAAIPGKRPSRRALTDSLLPNAQWSGWSARVRARLAAQVGHIRHWQVIEGDYTAAPDISATWYVDPPYDNAAGARYPHQPASFAQLGRWCRQRKGLTIVCEQAGADWLPFRPFRSIKANSSKGRSGASKEVIWLQRSAQPTAATDALAEQAWEQAGELLAGSPLQGDAWCQERERLCTQLLAEWQQAGSR
jgi:hypothetical protein